MAHPPADRQRQRDARGQFVDPEDIEAELSTLQDLVDRYGQRYRGVIQKIQHRRGVGAVKAHSGRLYTFSLATVYIGGLAKRLREVKPGMSVTFDLTHTEDGPRISHLWIGSQPAIPDALGLDPATPLDDLPLDD